MSELESQLKEKAAVDESSLIHELKDKLNQQNTKFEELERENEDLLVLMGKEMEIKGKGIYLYHLKVIKICK